MPASVVRARVPDKIWNNYYKFCVERNPWDKAISLFNMSRHRAEGNLTFEQFLKNKKFGINYKRYTSGWNRDKIIVDRVVRFEQLSEGLGEIFSLLGIPFSGELGTNAKGDYRVGKKHYREYYDDTSKKIIADVFEREIRMHGYVY